MGDPPLDPEELTAQAPTDPWFADARSHPPVHMRVALMADAVACATEFIHHPPILGAVGVPGRPPRLAGPLLPTPRPFGFRAPPSGQRQVEPLKPVRLNEDKSADLAPRATDAGKRHHSSRTERVARCRCQSCSRFTRPNADSHRLGDLAHPRVGYQRPATYLSRHC
jgi:hypothetical protein